tara:strand:+ start:2326 stop:3114 length:789 start_codon:yes stop_codon:yes gene_type:complete
MEQNVINKLTYRGHAMSFLQSKKGKEFIKSHSSTNTNEDYDTGYGITKTIPRLKKHTFHPTKSNSSTWHYDVNNPPFIKHDITLYYEKLLKDNFTHIKKEFENLKHTMEDHPENNVSNLSGRWSSIDLIDVNNKKTKALKQCPTLNKLLSNMNLSTGYGFVFFSRLEPDTSLVPHHGSSNIRSRIHLGLDVPQGDVGLKVGGEVVQCKTGETVCFDDSYAHSAWNLTNQMRDILIIDVFNPFIPLAETKILNNSKIYSFGKN